MAEAISAPVGGVQTDSDDTENYLKHGKGVLSWIFTLDHKRIGVMYLVAILASFFLGGVFAMLVRTELFTPEQTIMTADTYNKMFTLHGAVMIFLFIIPGIPATLGNFVLPQRIRCLRFQLDLAFPVPRRTTAPGDPKPEVQVAGCQRPVGQQIEAAEHGDDQAAANAARRAP